MRKIDGKIAYTQKGLSHLNLTLTFKLIEKCQKVNEYFQVDVFDSSRLCNLRAMEIRCLGKRLDTCGGALADNCCIYFSKHKPL